MESHSLHHLPSAQTYAPLPFQQHCLPPFSGACLPPFSGASLVVQLVKHLPAMQEPQVQSLGREDPLEKEMAAHSRFLLAEFHGERSLVGYSPWGRKESDTTEQLTHTHTHTYTHTHMIH